MGTNLTFTLSQENSEFDVLSDISITGGNILNGNSCVIPIENGFTLVENQRNCSKD